MSDIVSISSDTIKTQPTTTIDYVDNETQAGRMSSESIQEYIVIVNLPEDWDTVHTVSYTHLTLPTKRIV